MYHRNTHQPFMIGGSIAFHHEDGTPDQEYEILGYSVFDSMISLVLKMPDRSEVVVQFYFLDWQEDIVNRDLCRLLKGDEPAYKDQGFPKREDRNNSHSTDLHPECASVTIKLKK